MNAKPRTAKCQEQDCQAIVTAKSNGGAVPQRCPECTKKHVAARKNRVRIERMKDPTYKAKIAQHKREWRAKRLAEQAAANPKPPAPIVEREHKPGARRRKSAAETTDPLELAQAKQKLAKYETGHRWPVPKDGEEEKHYLTDYQPKERVRPNYPVL